MKVKIYWKFTAVYSLLIIAILIGVYAYLNASLTEFFETRIEDNLKKNLLLVRNLLNNELNAAADPATADGLAGSIGRELGLRVTIIDSEGGVIGDSELDKEALESLENHSARFEIVDALKTGFGRNRRFSTSIKKGMLYMAMPFGRDNRTGVIRLSIPLSDILLMRANIRRIIALAMPVAVMAAFVAGLLISIRLSGPLREMSMIASRLAEGDFSKKAAIYSGDESEDLARSLNDMAREINNKLKRLSSEKAKLETVLSGMFEGVMLTDKKGVILLVNPAMRKMFMVETDPYGKRPIEVLRNNRIQDLVDRVLAAREAAVAEEITSGIDGNKTLKVNAVPISRQDATEGAVLVFHDMTELRRLEQVRRDFVASVSHELKTPVTSIKGYAETLLHGALGDKKHAPEFVRAIYDESERLARLVEDILDLSGIESGRMKMSFSRVSADAVVKRAVAIMENQAREKEVTIGTEISPGLPDMKADEARLMQVLINLFDNAIKYTPAQGRIAVRVTGRSGFIDFKVADTGAGIPENDIPRIFERFYRVDKARSRELGGTGLGLSIVKHIVQAHGGEVSVVSEPGRGATFFFTIPIA